MDTRSLETASAATLGLVGFMLLLPFSTFEANPTAFATMAYLPEWAWGGLLMLVALAQAYAVARDHAQYRRWTALAAATLYAFLAALYFVANARNLGSPVWAVHAAGNLYALYSLRRRYPATLGRGHGRVA